MGEVIFAYSKLLSSLDLGEASVARLAIFLAVKHNMFL